MVHQNKIRNLVAKDLLRGRKSKKFADCRDRRSKDARKSWQQDYGDVIYVASYNSYWVRFISPDYDPRPFTVPAPCPWWRTGYAADKAIICALVTSVSEDNLWKGLEKYWPGLQISFCDQVDSTWQPDRSRFRYTYPTSNTWTQELL